MNWHKLRRYMSALSLFYDILKPISDFEIVVGGTNLPIDFDNGTILITPLFSSVITRSDKNFKDIIARGDKHYIIQSSKLKETYQIDFYKVNPQNETSIIAYDVAKRVQEYLKSYDVSEYLKRFDVEILPNFEVVSYTNDFTEQKKLVNRAFFEFSVYFYENILQEIKIFDKIVVNNHILRGGNNE